MNTKQILWLIPLFLLVMTTLVIAESRDIEDDSAVGTSIELRDSSAEVGDPFAVEANTVVSVETVLDDNEIDDSKVGDILGTEDTTRVHIISYGQGYLVSSTGQISLVNGLWNVVTSGQLTMGRGQLRIGGVELKLKATESTETKKGFDLYKGNVKVGMVTFSRTQSDSNNALWDMNVNISAGNRSLMAKGVFATVTRSVSKVRNDDSTDNQIREQDKEAREAAREEAKQNREVAKKWWQFWKRADKVQEDRSGSDSGSQ